LDAYKNAQNPNVDVTEIVTVLVKTRLLIASVLQAASAIFVRQAARPARAQAFRKSGSDF
jgi:HD-like signal output (HDOD) protein